MTPRRELIICQNMKPHRTAPCGTVMGELVQGRLEVTRVGLIAMSGTVLLTCRSCGATRLIDLAPTPLPRRLDTKAG